MKNIIITGYKRFNVFRCHLKILRKLRTKVVLNILERVTADSMRTIAYESLRPETLFFKVYVIHEGSKQLQHYDKPDI